MDPVDIDSAAIIEEADMPTHVRLREISRELRGCGVVLGACTDPIVAKVVKVIAAAALDLAGMAERDEVDSAMWKKDASRQRERADVLAGQVRPSRAFVAYFCPIDTHPTKHRVFFEESQAEEYIGREVAAAAERAFDEERRADDWHIEEVSCG